MAFFLWSMHSEPARVVVMVEGGVCRRPGPSLRGMEGMEGIGRTSDEMVSPGRTTWSVIVLPTEDSGKRGVGKIPHITSISIHRKSTRVQDLA